jgi:ribonucleoside-diphosphate reductase beta chain
MIDTHSKIEAINWNTVPDKVDKTIWDKLLQNFWLPEKIALSNDLKTWSTFSADEKLATTKVFAGLTLLDTIQSKVGAIELLGDAQTPHEEAVMTNISFMEAVHARSYSSIFSTLLSSDEIDEAFLWARSNPYLNKKADIIMGIYRGTDPQKKKIASVLLEGFLFYSGFFMPFWWSSRAKLTNTADIIRLILRDESIHSYYIGYKFQKALRQFPLREEELKAFAYELTNQLYDNEVRYTRELYDEIGLTEYVLPYIRYQGNKALAALGFEALWPPSQTEVTPTIMSALSLGGENHDFFSGAGSTYISGTEEETTDDDWDF